MWPPAPPAGPPSSSPAIMAMLQPDVWPTAPRTPLRALPPAPGLTVAMLKVARRALIGLAHGPFRGRCKLPGRAQELSRLAVAKLKEELKKLALMPASAVSLPKTAVRAGGNALLTPLQYRKPPFS